MTKEEIKRRIDTVKRHQRETDLYVDAYLLVAPSRTGRSDAMTAQEQNESINAIYQYFLRRNDRLAKRGLPPPKKRSILPLLIPLANADEDQWITVESGQHVLLGEGGEIKAGMGGKFTGKKMSEVVKGEKNQFRQTVSLEKLQTLNQKNQKFNVYGQSMTVDEILEKGSPQQIKMLAGDYLKIPTKDFNKALKNNALGDVIKQKMDETIQAERDRASQQIENRNSPEFNSWVSDKVAKGEKSLTEVIGKYGEMIISPREYFDMHRAGTDSMTAEEITLLNAYRGDRGGLGTNYHQLNGALRLGKALNDTEQAVVDTLVKHASPVSRDCVLYRGENTQLLEEMLGGQITNSKDLTQLVGKETVLKALTSTAPGVPTDFSHRANTVVSKFSISKGTKISAMPGGFKEGEFVLLPNQKVRIKGITTTNEFPSWNYNSALEARVTTDTKTLVEWEVINDG
jgi:hypothetical protein